MPTSQPPSPELAARAAALTHLPTNLSIKTQKPAQPFVGFAAGPALAAVQDSKEQVSNIAAGSGEGVEEESDNAFWEEGAVLQLASYDEPCTPFAGQSLSQSQDPEIRFFINKALMMPSLPCCRSEVMDLTSVCLCRGKGSSG